MYKILKKAAYLLPIILLGIIVNILTQKEHKITLIDTREKKHEKIIVRSKNDIVLINDEDEFIDPIIYDVNMLDFSKYHVSPRKRMFISVMMPSILIVDRERREEKLKTEKILFTLGDKTKSERNYLDKMYKKYKIEDRDYKELLTRMSTHPPCITIAQAAIETGWGTSRFFRKANNVFGVWSFSENDNRIEALGNRNGRKIYLKKYDSIYESVKDYYRNISTNIAYKDFRIASSKTDEYLKITKYLDKYSEIGNEYIEMLNGVIEYNDFEKYNNLKLTKED